MDIQTLAIITLLGSFAVMIFLRFPIAYAVGLSSVFCLLVQDKSLMDVCRLMVKGISSFSLMAVPFFRLLIRDSISKTIMAKPAMGIGRYCQNLDSLGSAT